MQQQMQQVDDREKILNQWLLFMLERVGHNNLPLLLDHYEKLRWISADVSDRLISLAEALNKRYEGPSWTLSAEEHRISMLFIEKLKGKSIDIPRVSAISPSKTKILQFEKDSPRESYIEAYKLEKNELEFEVQRREVTVKNLEVELEKKEIEINGLKETIQQLEHQLNESMDELKKEMIFRGLLEENIRLKKGEFRKCV